MSKLILAVDDEVPIHKALARMLGKHGYTIVGVSNGQEALAYLLHELRPDVILLDVKMPVMDGPAFLAALRADPALASIPVVAMPAAPGASLPDNVERVEKPFDLEKLLAALARCGK